MGLPKLVVFDLDYTLWPFWVDTHVDPPFSKNSDGGIIDSRGHVVQCYGDVWAILTELRENNVQIAVASRTTEVAAAQQLVQLFNWSQFLCNQQIYPGSKLTHFTRFHLDTGVPYKDMLFFDDESRNIKDVSTLGVTCIHAEEGISMAVFRQGLSKFSQQHGKPYT